MRPHIAYVSFSKPLKGKALGKRGRLDAIRGSGFFQKVKQMVTRLPYFSRYPGETEIAHYYRGNGFTHEIEAFMSGVSSGLLESEVMPLDDTLEMMKLMDNLRASWLTLEK